jgi:hypothetical protein
LLHQIFSGVRCVPAAYHDAAVNIIRETRMCSQAAAAGVVVAYVAAEVEAFAAHPGLGVV